MNSHHSSQEKEAYSTSRAPSQGRCRPDAEAATLHSYAGFTIHACTLKSVLFYCFGASHQWLVFHFFCELLLLRYGQNLARGYHSFHYCYREFHWKKYNLLPHLCCVCRSHHGQRFSKHSCLSPGIRVRLFPGTPTVELLVTGYITFNVPQGVFPLSTPAAGAGRGGRRSRAQQCS